MSDKEKTAEVSAQENDKKQTLEDVAQIHYLTKDNTVFKMQNEFLTLKTPQKNEDGVEEEKEFPRVFLHRAFPFDDPFAYISVLDKDLKEIGLIKKIDDFPEDVATMLKNELTRKYYAPKVTKIISVKERYGFSYWKVTTDAGDMTFTLQDTYRSILKVGNGRVFIIDMDGNRYEIPNVEELEFASYRKIELYL